MQNGRIERPLFVVLGSLALAELDLADLCSLTGSANNSLLTTVSLADRLFEVLSALYGSNNARLLNFAVKAAQQVFERFLGVFAGNLYHT